MATSTKEEKTRQVAADRPPHPRSRAPDGFHASLVTRNDLMCDEALNSLVSEVRAAVDSRFKGTEVNAFRLENAEDLIKYSPHDLD